MLLGKVRVREHVEASGKRFSSVKVTDGALLNPTAGMALAPVTNARNSCTVTPVSSGVSV